jgi:NADH:ubiquinone oxidoreductase subunit 2 (subunit N)
MSAPFIWIAIPGLAAFLLLIFRLRKRATLIASIVLALLLAWLAWQLPVGESFSLRLWAGFPSFKISESVTILEQRFTLDHIQTQLLILLYLGLALWLGGAYTAQADRLFPALSLGIAAVLSASLAAESSQFTALTIIFVTLLCVPILSPPRKGAGRGVIRLLAFQTLGVCLILFSDAYLAATGIEPGRSDAVRLAVSLASLGFALTLAVFPFHTWFPMLGETGNPYTNAFVFLILPVTIFLSILEYSNRFTLLGLASEIYPLIRFAGVLMVLSGGVWAAFERHLGRLLAFAATVQIGTGLLALSLTGQGANSSFTTAIFYASLVPFAVGLAVGSQGMAALRKQAGSLGFLSLRGLAFYKPIAALSAVLALFSLAGLPLLASFPINLALWSALAQESRLISLLALLGSAGLLTAGMLSLAALISSQKEPAGESTDNSAPPGRVVKPERGFQAVILVLGCLALFVVGLMPNWLFTLLGNLAQISTGPGP